MVWGRLDKMALEHCICTIALALATVMAGSGHLQTLCLLRGVLQPPAFRKTAMGPVMQCALSPTVLTTSYSD